MTVLSSDNSNRLDFPHFEARAYWKISLCFLYLFLIFYSYFTKGKIPEKPFVYIISPFVSILIYLLFVLITHKSDYNADRIWIYLIYMIFEEMFTIEIILLIKMDEIKESGITGLGWTITEIDFFRYLLGISFALVESIKYCYKKCRYCQKIRNNFTKSI